MLHQQILFWNTHRLLCGWGGRGLRCAGRAQGVLDHARQAGRARDQPLHCICGALAGLSLSLGLQMENTFLSSISEGLRSGTNALDKTTTQKFYKTTREKHWWQARCRPCSIPKFLLQGFQSRACADVEQLLYSVIDDRSHALRVKASANIPHHCAVSFPLVQRCCCCPERCRLCC